MTSIAATSARQNSLLNCYHWRNSTTCAISLMVLIKTMMAISALGCGQHVNLVCAVHLKKLVWVNAKYGQWLAFWEYLSGINRRWLASHRVSLMEIRLMELRCG